jgi:hypothetical protein
MVWNFELLFFVWLFQNGGKENIIFQPMKFGLGHLLGLGFDF